MGEAPDNLDQSMAAMRVYVETLFDEMQQKLVHQRLVVLRCMDGMIRPAVDASALRRQRELQDAVHETIEVLEETKKSFKSKRLGDLRSKLERVLTGSNV